MERIEKYSRIVLCGCTYQAIENDDIDSEMPTSLRKQLHGLMRRFQPNVSPDSQAAAFVTSCVKDQLLHQFMSDCP
jgi:hypothetical protein